MKTQHRMDTGNGVFAVIQIPTKKRLKVKSIFATMGPTDTNDQVFVNFLVSGLTVAKASSNALSSSMTFITAMTGLANSDTLIPTNTSLATGNVTYNQPSDSQMGLPDIEWENTIQITVTMTAGAVTTGIMFYELDGAN